MPWKTNIDKLEQTLEFRSQTALAEFLLKVANFADQENHHPDYVIRKCSLLDISLTTHDAGGITEKDHQLANFIDELIKNEKIIKV